MTYRERKPWYTGRQLWQDWIGRRLEREEVHHLDEQGGNNTADDLQMIQAAEQIRKSLSQCQSGSALFDVGEVLRAHILIRRDYMIHVRGMFPNMVSYIKDHGTIVCVYYLYHSSFNLPHVRPGNFSFFTPAQKQQPGHCGSGLVWTSQPKFC